MADLTEWDPSTGGSPVGIEVGRKVRCRCEHQEGVSGLTTVPLMYDGSAVQLRPWFLRQYGTALSLRANPKAPPPSWQVDALIKKIDLYAWRPDEPMKGLHTGRGPEPSKSSVVDPTEVEGVSGFIVMLCALGA